MEYVIEEGTLKDVIAGEDETIAIIPEGVTVAADQWTKSEYRSRIKKVVFPEGFQTLKSHAFYGYDSLEVVDFPASLRLLEHFYCMTLRYVIFRAEPRREWTKWFTSFAYLGGGPEVFTAPVRVSAIRGFLDAVFDSVEVSEDVLEAYHSYMARNAKSVAAKLLDEPRKIQYMIDHGFLKPKTAVELIPIAEENRKTYKNSGFPDIALEYDQSKKVLRKLSKS